jgi:hypothetical protein
MKTFATLEFPMRRHSLTAAIAMLMPLLYGCAKPAPGVVVTQAHDGSFACRLHANAATPGPELQLVVHPDHERGNLQIMLDHSDRQTLDPVAQSPRQVYADARYAWYFEGSGGVLTDIRNITTYDCIGGGSTPLGVQ